jgi:enhancing lycopene biosynthesis protein 2
MSTPSQNSKKVAVVLSGCGYLDGSEITEAVSALIALSEAGAEALCFAPNESFVPASHLDGGAAAASATGSGGAVGDSPRNALAEAARIARGNIQDLRELNEKNFDALVFPGGFGAAKNLSNWASAGANGRVNPEVMRVITEFHKAAKPIGAICIAPTLIAKALGSEGVTVTIGDDQATANELEKTGAHHVKCAVTDYVSDRDHKVLTTPAYMYEAKPHEVFAGIRKMIRELVEMA